MDEFSLVLDWLLEQQTELTKWGKLAEKRVLSEKKIKNPLFVQIKFEVLWKCKIGNGYATLGYGDWRSKCGSHQHCDYK